MAKAELHAAPVRFQWIRVSWVVAMLSIFALPAAWYWWSYERVSARQLQQLHQRELVLAPLESKVSSRLAGWKSVQASLASVKEKIKATGESPDLWTRRTITIDNQHMSRVEAEQYLRDLTNNEHNLLVPAAILVRASKPGESVFTSHQGQDGADALLVTIKADLYTRGIP
jgi:hypothetical protein